MVGLRRPSAAVHRVPSPWQNEKTSPAESLVARRFAESPKACTAVPRRSAEKWPAMDTYRSGMQFPANAVIKISQTAYSRLRVKWTFPVSAIFRNSGDEIRETRRAGRGVFCSECGVLLEDPEEDAQWHFEDHEGRPERN